MQMVSAIKMRKAQAAEIEGRPYRETLDNVIHKISPKIDVSHSLLLSEQKTNSDKDLIIFISSNKGLCGSFHMNLDRYLLKNIDFEKTDFIGVGKKGSMFVNIMKGKVIADYSTNKPLVEVSAIFKLALDSYLSGNYKKVSIFYNKFISTLRSEPRLDFILPFKIAKETENKNVMQGDYVIEPEPAEIIDSLLKSAIEEKIRGAIISSEAVEHSSRMIAMKNATDNATDVIYNLTLLGNKVRQTKITSELLDMITAKESVEN